MKILIVLLIIFYTPFLRAQDVLTKFPTPRGWNIAEGCGNIVARLNNSSDGQMALRLFDEDSSSNLDLSSLVANEFGGAVLKSAQQFELDKKNISYAVFDFKSGIAGEKTGAMFLHKLPSVALTLTCSSKKENFLGVFLECKNLITKMDVKSLNLEKKKIDLPSQSVVMKIWNARMDGDDILLKKLAEKYGDDFCGSSGAIAAYNIGLFYEKNNLQEAIKYFTKAIEADPSYVSAYLSLGRAYLNQGVNARVTKGRLNAIIARAPQTREIEELKKKLEGL